MAGISLVPTAGGNTHYTLRTIKVSICNPLLCSPMLCQYWLGKREIQALLVKCPNAECGGIVQRKEFKRHVRIMCPHTVIPCKYKGIGCDTQLKRKDMAAHERNDKFHLHMVMDRVSLESQTLKNGGSMTYSVPEFENLRKNSEEFFSSPFYTHLRGYHMTLEVDANGYSRGEGTHVSVFAAILEGEYDAELKWPFVGKVHITLLNQLNDRNHLTDTLLIGTKHDMRAGHRWGYPIFVPHSELTHDPVKNKQHLKDDTLYFRVSVEVANHKPWLECTIK